MLLSETPYFDRKSKALFAGTLVLSVALQLYGLPESLDKKFFYTGEYAQEFLFLLSDQQDAVYIRQCFLDLIFILFYTTLTAIEFRKVTRHPLLQKIAFLPGAFDLIETGSILVILLQRHIWSKLDWLGYMTCLKWVTSSVALVMWFFLWTVKRRKFHQT